VEGVYCGDEEDDPLGRERKRAAWVGSGQVEKGRWRKGEGRGWTVEVRNQNILGYLLKLIIKI
jgi:hypothetical protein